MKKILKALPQFFFFILFSIIFSMTNAQANNLSISNVRLEDRNPSTNTLVVKFNISWENSWKTKINHDAVWLTVRLYNPTQTPTEKKLCRISSSGLNPSGVSVGTASNLEVYVPSDKSGVFLRPSGYGMNNTMTSQDVALTVDYSNGGFSNTDTVSASVFGLEMVLIPEGAFYAGDRDTSASSLDQGSSDSDPWYVSGETLLSITNSSSNGYRYVSAGNAGEDATGTAFTLAASYPKGYKSFYAMKYEITEREGVGFFNSLPSASR
ncbi:MAG: hypothetical protein HQL24_01485, partial [Candidatus Omnitrophica bacterium]|nr:hypothetical protein [Candidatus Omnitrophota bacterium]